MADRHSVDEYLETIYFLAFPIGEYTPRGAGSPPLASRVAEMLHVSRASAGEMLKRLEAEGLIERGARKEALMTDRGRERAERVVRKHRLIERLLTDFMGYTGAEAHERADQLGDTFTDEMIDRIDERLGHPERCPHGWPVDPDVEQAENPELAPLAALAPGARATIVRLAEHDGELLHWFYDQGLVPGQEIEVRAAEPAADQLTIRLDGGDRAAAADVHGLSVGAVPLQGEAERPRDVPDGDEVATLPAVLEDTRRPVVQQAGGEDREHAGVRVRERLPRAIRVEQAQRDGRN